MAIRGKSNKRTPQIGEEWNDPRVDEYGDPGDEGFEKQLWRATAKPPPGPVNPVKDWD
jgi:hypothetical protein